MSHNLNEPSDYIEAVVVEPKKPAKRGPPSTLILSVVLCVFAAIVNALFAVWSLASGQWSTTWVNVFWSAVLAYGLVQGHRAAFFLAASSAVLFMAWTAMVAGPTFLGLQQNRLPPHVTQDTAIFYIGVHVIQMICLLVMTFVLTWSQEAKTYFDVICPSCKSEATNGTDPLYNQMKCNDCERVWS